TVPSRDLERIRKVISTAKDAKDAKELLVGTTEGTEGTEGTEDGCHVRHSPSAMNSLATASGRQNSRGSQSKSPRVARAYRPGGFLRVLRVLSGGWHLTCLRDLREVDPVSWTP